MKKNKELRMAIAQWEQVKILFKYVKKNNYMLSTLDFTNLLSYINHCVYSKNTINGKDKKAFSLLKKCLQCLNRIKEKSKVENNEL